MDDIALSELPVLSYPRTLGALTDSLGRAAESQALLLVNFDDLLELQAQLGFQASSALVSSLAGSFATALGGRAAALRLGDASCCVLVNGVRNGGHAMLAADKLLRVADAAMSESGLTVRPGLSIGVALCPGHATEAAGLLRKAQLAAAAARKRSRRSLVYDDGCAGLALQPAQLSLEFEHALETGALTVHYQPKVRIGDGQVSGAEALMRWLRDGKPVTTPEVFIPLAERAGLIHDTTWYALGNALRTSVALQGLHVAVNITPGMLHHREFSDMVETAVRSWNVARGVLTLELTEGALIADFDEATARLMRVRDLGVRVSIDDFGTGYSSLSYFKKIPADEIKIDKSFVRQLLQDKDNQRLVRTIIALAGQFELEVVAEGVEDRATLRTLAAMGCDHVQGHLFTAALDEDSLRSWLDQHAAGDAAGLREKNLPPSAFPTTRLR